MVSTWCFNWDISFGNFITVSSNYKCILGQISSHYKNNILRDSEDLPNQGDQRYSTDETLDTPIPTSSKNLEAGGNDTLQSDGNLGKYSTRVLANWICSKCN